MEVDDIKRIVYPGNLYGWDNSLAVLIEKEDDFDGKFVLIDPLKLGIWTKSAKYIWGRVGIKSSAVQEV